VVVGVVDVLVALVLVVCVALLDVKLVMVGLVRLLLSVNVLDAVVVVRVEELD
jgi:hypothetical protein